MVAALVLFDPFGGLPKLERIRVITPVPVVVPANATAAAAADAAVTLT